MHLERPGFLLIAIFVAFGSAGCSCGGAEDPDGTGDSDADSDTDSDGDTDTDSQTGGDCDDEGATRCIDGGRQICDPERGWLTDPCPVDETCIGDGDCMPFICEPGQIRCDENDSSRVERCASSGAEWILHQECEAGQICIDGECEDAECQEGDGVCVGGLRIRYCDDTGTGYDDPVDCPEGQGCADGECIDQICEPGEGNCLDTENREECDSSGTAWEEEDCDPDSRACEDGICRLRICPPGLRRCEEDGSVVECNDNGTGFDDAGTCDDETIGEACVDGECTDACDRAAFDRTSVGCVFYGVDMNNADEDPDDDGDTIDESQYAIVVANPDPTLVADVEVETRGASGWSSVETTTLDPDELYTFELPDRHVENTDTNDYGAYRVTSTTPIIAYQFQPIDSAGEYSNDASLLLPRSTVDNDYYVPAWSTLYIPGGLFTAPLYYRSSVDIVITEDDTDVTITTPVATLSGGGIPALTAGGSTTIEDMLETDVLQIESSGDTDLTGLLVESDKPVAVFGGCECALVPEPEVSCDHLEEQIFPLATWGTSYVASRAPRRSSGSTFVEPSIWRIMAGEPDITVSFDAVAAVDGLPTTDITLSDAGDFVEYSVDGTVANPGDFVITADGPILVTQYLVGQEATNWPINNRAEAADPDMVLSVPTDQYLTKYIFLTPNTYTTDYVVVARPADVTVTLDGTAIADASFIDVGSGVWQVARIVVSDGVHTIEASEPFGINAVGYAPAVSYAYPGGMNLQAINPQE